MLWSRRISLPPRAYRDMLDVAFDLLFYTCGKVYYDYVLQQHSASTYQFIQFSIYKAQSDAITEFLNTSANLTSSHPRGRTVQHMTVLAPTLVQVTAALSLAIGFAAL